VLETRDAIAEDLILRARLGGDEVEASGGTTEDAWRAMAQELAARGEGRSIR
jgi:hypothetical protein